LFQEDKKLGSIEDLVIDTEERKGREPEMIDKGGIMIPKLDFSSIYIQREVVSSQNGEDEDQSLA
jgi:hypothetical protein